MAAPVAVIYEVQAADVHAASADGTPQSLPAERLWWISVAARVLPALATTSKAKRERKAGRLTLNGDATASTNTPVVVGDRIAYEPPQAAWNEEVHVSTDGLSSTQQRKQSPQKWCEICRRQGLRVTFDSDEFAVVVKPVGVHVKGRGWRTVENALPTLLRPCPASHPDSVLPNPHAVHRLDYRVGGLLLVAKTRGAEVALSRQFEKHRVLKRYRAILVGRLDPTQFTSDQSSLSPPADFSSARGLQVFSNEPVYYVSTPIDGKPSCSAFAIRSVSPSARYEWLTTVDLWPLTGRWHQLRVHMASLGHPIVGDDLHHNHQTTHDDVAVDTEVVRGAGLFLYAVALSFEDQRGNRRSFEIDEPHKFGRFRHFCALNREKQQRKANRAPPKTQNAT